MSVKLPDGFIYVGQTLSVSDSAKLKVKFCFHHVYITPDEPVYDYMNEGSISGAGDHRLCPLRRLVFADMAVRGRLDLRDMPPW